MNERDQENLKELFEKFFDGEQAESCVEDIRKGEQILGEHPAPEPDDMLIADIKAQIVMRLQARRARRFRRILYEVLGAAAAIIVIAAVSLQLSQQRDGRGPGTIDQASILPTDMWVSDDVITADQDLATFTTQIDQIEDEVQTLQSGQEPGNTDSTIEELEMELVEINSDFWKG